MKVQTVIDPTAEERVVIYAREKSELVNAIEHLVTDTAFELVGYRGREGVRLDAREVACFIVEGGRVYAVTGKERLELRCRLYQLETALSEDFVKIHQSALANIRQIASFDASISGTMRVHFKNGYGDYVSRRCLKQVKERLGL